MNSGTPLDVFEIAAALDRHQVDYVLIGGVAMQAYGHVRTTQDMDIITVWERPNITRLAGALRELHARLRGVDADLLGIDVGDPDDLYEAGNLTMQTTHGDLDIFEVRDTPGAPGDYGQLRRRALALQIRGVRMLVADPEDLIRMKTAAAQLDDRNDRKRTQDLDDIKVLKQLALAQTERPTAEDLARQPDFGSKDRGPEW